MTASGHHRPGRRLLALLPDALPDVRRVVARFPLPALLAALYTLYLLFALGRSAAVPTVIAVRWPLVAEAGYLASLAGMLLGEARGWSGTGRFLAGGVGLSAVAVLVAAGYVLDLVWIVLVLALALGIGLVPYLSASAKPAAYWLFNHQLWIAAGVALAGAVLFAAGVSLIFASLTYLFGLAIPAWAYEKVWILALALIAPVTWLDLVPERLDAEVAEGPQTELTSQGVAVLVRFVMVPLLLVYALILHAYAAKILATWSLPRGQIGWMAMSYGTVMALTALLAFPTHDVSGPLVRVFWRAWAWLLPVPVALLLIAAFVRIGQYGVTEPRYVLVAGAVWLLSIAGLQLWPRARSDVRGIVLPLALVALVASFGPWGMLGTSVRSQTKRLVASLASVGVVKDGRFAGRLADPMSMPGDARQRISGGLVYLSRLWRIDRLAPLFHGAGSDPFASAARSITTEDRARFAAIARYAIPPSATIEVDKLTAAMGLAAISPEFASQSGRVYRYFSAASPALLAVERPSRLIGPLFVASAAKAAPTRFGTAAEDSVSLALADGVVTVTAAGGKVARFDIVGSADLMAHMKGTIILPGDRLHSPVRIARAAGSDLEADLLLVNANGFLVDGDRIDFTNLSAWLELPR